MSDPNNPPKETPPKSITVTVWNPSMTEAKRLRLQARTVNSNKSRGPKRASVIEVPRD